MKQFTSFVTGLSQQLDKIAGLCFVAVMVVVVCNALLRVIFNHPILGTYDLVSLLTALGIALALGNCALKNAHIAVDFIIERFPLRYRIIIDSIMDSAALIFWSFAVGHLCIYAANMSGLVSSTAEIPVYPIIYLLALGITGLCLVLILRWLDSVRKVFAALSPARLISQDGWINNTRKAIR